MQLKVTLKRSTIGCPKDQVGTVHALGLKKIGQSIIKEANDSVKGQINKVKHLVDVEEI